MSWRTHSIEPLGVRVELIEGWPLETWERAEGGGLFQPLAGANGGLFVRWGATASAEDFRKSLTDLLTTPIELREAEAEVLGRTALRISATVERAATVTYRHDRQGAVVHEETPAARTRTEAVSFVHRGVPVLIGYRVAPPSFRKHAALFRRFLASVRLDR